MTSAHYLPVSLEEGGILGLAETILAPVLNKGNLSLSSQHFATG